MNNQGRNKQVCNTSENNNQNEAIRYISYREERAIHSSLTPSLVNTRNANEIFSLRRIHAPYTRADQTRVRSFSRETNNRSQINLNSSLGRDEQVYNTSENNNQNETIRYISYTPAVQTHTRSLSDETNNNASINPNSSLGLSSSNPTRFVFSHGRRTSIANQEVHLNSPLRRTLTQREVGESSTSNTIQIDEHQPHIRLRCDPELVRAMVREMMLQVEMHGGHMRNESGLTEDEIMKHITCGNFEARVEGTSENKELCCICQEAFEIGEEIGRLDCAHIFHMNCIKEWLLEKNICPLCKRRGLFVGDE